MTLPAAVHAVVDLFQTTLSELRFADVDGNTLAKLALEAEAKATEVEMQERRLAELRDALTEQQDALFLHAQRALAYARVYAEDDAALTEQLRAIILTRANKRGRPVGSGAHREADRSAPGDLEQHPTDGVSESHRLDDDAGAQRRVPVPRRVRRPNDAVAPSDATAE